MTSTRQPNNLNDKRVVEATACYIAFLELSSILASKPLIEARIVELRDELTRLGKTDFANERGWLSNSPMDPSNRLFFTLEALAGRSEICANTEKAKKLTAEIHEGLVELKNQGVLTEEQFNFHEEGLTKRLPNMKLVGAIGRGIFSIVEFRRALFSSCSRRA